MPVVPPELESLADEYAAWWIDLLGEHNHIGGSEATRWLLERSGLAPGKRMLDCGAFVGGAARLAAARAGATAVALDIDREFLHTGRRLETGDLVSWVTGDSRRMPFRDAAFDSVWALDTHIDFHEINRVAAPGATLCICSEAPVDSRGGADSFIQDWAYAGWTLTAHKEMTNEATQTWRRAEAELVRRRPYYEQRYGTRPYLAQLDLLSLMVASYERLQQGHGLFVFTRIGVTTG